MKTTKNTANELRQIIVELREEVKGHYEDIQFIFENSKKTITLADIEELNSRKSQIEDITQQIEDFKTFLQDMEEQK